MNFVIFKFSTKLTLYLILSKIALNFVLYSLLFGSYLLTNIQILRQIAIPFLAIFLALPSYLTPNASRLVLSPPAPRLFAAVDVAAAARVCECEAKGESRVGQIYVIDALKNRAAKDSISIVASSFDKICRGKLTPAFIELAANFLRQEPSHPFCFFLNENLATDIEWVAYSKTQIRIRIGAHWFF